MERLQQENSKIAKEVEILRAKVKSLAATQNLLKVKPSGCLGGFLGSPSPDMLHFDKVREIHELLAAMRFEDAEKIVEHDATWVENKFDVQNQYGETPLMLAIRSRNSELCSHLLEEGADPKVLDNLGKNALMMAARYGALTLLQGLVETVDVNIKTHSLGRTALHFAAEADDAEVVKALLSNGANPCSRDRDGNLPSNLANNQLVISLFKKMEATSGTPEYPTGSCEALSEADIARNSESVDKDMVMLVHRREELVSEGQCLQFQLQDLQQRRVRSSAGSGKGRLCWILHRLVPGFRKRDEMMRTYHAFADSECSPETVDSMEQFLDKYTARRMKWTMMYLNLDSCDGNGKTVLIKAAERGIFEIVSYLVLYNCNINIRDGEGYTALMRAAQLGHLEIVQHLVEVGAKVNVRSKQDRRTALMLAAQNGHVEICQVLVREGANHLLVDRSHKTAAELASTPEEKKKLGELFSEYPLSKAT